MIGFLARVVASACGLAVAAWLFDGIRVVGHGELRRLVTLLIAAAIFAAVNEFVRPIVAALSLPLYILTLGLMFFIVNALMLLLTGWIAKVADVGFQVHGFWTALVAAIVVGFVSWLVTLVLPNDK